MAKQLEIPKKKHRDRHSGFDDEMRKSLRALVITLAEACKVDGRVSIDGNEFSVQLASSTQTVGYGELLYAPCMVEANWEVDEVRSMSSPVVRHIPRYQTMTITVDHTVTRWILHPLGKSVPGQQRIEQQAGSPKPEPEILEKEVEDWEEYYMDEEEWDDR